MRFSEKTKRYWRRGIVFGVFLALAFWIGNSLRVEPALMNSAEVLSLLERGAVKVGVRSDMPGMGEEGLGLEPALAEAIARRLFPEEEVSSVLELVEVSAMTAEAKLSDGSIDIAISMMPMNASAACAYSEAYYTDVCRFVVRKNGWLTLTKGTVGCIQNSPAEDLLDAFLTAHPDYGVTKQLFSSYPDMLTALNGERIDSAILSELYIRKYQDSYAFQITDTSPGAIDYAIAAPADSAAFARIADLMLADMKASGRLSVLYRESGLWAD